MKVLDLDMDFFLDGRMSACAAGRKAAGILRQTVWRTNR